MVVPWAPLLFNLSPLIALRESYEWATLILFSIKQHSICFT